MIPLGASLLAVGVGWFLIFSLLVIQGKPTRRICWKNMVNSGLTLVLLTLFLFAVLGFLAFILPLIANQLPAVMLFWANEPNSLLALSVSVPALALLSVLILYISVLSTYKALEWKYTAGEKQLLKQRREERIAKHPRLSKFLGYRANKLTVEN